jgi:hypothetical protein
MPDTALIIKFGTLGLLGLAYLLLSKRIMRVDANQPFHVATYQRDRRKARFYSYSVWVGLAVAFLSFITLEALAGMRFDANATREAVLNVLYGAGLWGLMIIALVWSQLGQRVALVGSDGKSMQTLPDEKNRSRE